MRHQLLIVAALLLATAAAASQTASTWVIMEVDQEGKTAIIAAKPSHQPPSPCRAHPAGDSDRVVVSYVHPETGKDCHVSHSDPRKEFHDHDKGNGKLGGGVRHHERAQFAVTLHLGATTFSAVDLKTGRHTKAQHTLVQAHRNQFSALETVVNIDASKVQSSTLQLVGPTTQQKNMVFLSAGYTAAEQSKFDTNVQEVLTTLSQAENKFGITAQPYTRYFSTMNFFKVFYPSTESGASHPAPAGDGTAVNNNLDCSYGSTSGRILSCSRTKVQLVGSYAPPDPTTTLYIVLVNDALFGGTGGSNVCSVYNGDKMFVVLVHEIGHAGFDLSDEYDYGITESKQVAMKNCHHTNTDTPWNAWILSGILPRPSSVCTYSNYYKSTPGTCLMESDQKTMCPVCREAVLTHMYTTGINLASPRWPSQYETVYVEKGSGVLLHINNILPTLNDATGFFNVEWKMDNTTVATGVHKIGFNDAAGTALNATASATYTAAGTFEVTVIITDNTNMFLAAERARLMALPNETLKQTHKFRVVVYAAGTTVTCTKRKTAYGTEYCAKCDEGQDANCALEFTSQPLTSLSEDDAELAGFDSYLYIIGGVFLFLGVVSFFLVWKSLQIQAASRISEVMPLAVPVMIVRYFLMFLQILMLIAMTLAMVFSVYMYSVLSVFGRSVILGLVAIAAVVWFASFLGFCAAYYKDREVLFVNFVLMIILLGCAILFTFLLMYVYFNIDEPQTIAQLHGEWQDSVTDDPAAVCNLQNALKCSGFNTSCVTLSSTLGTSDCPASCSTGNKHGYPCLRSIRTFILDQFLKASLAGVIVCFFIFVCMLLALVLGCNIKSNRMATYQRRRDRAAAGEHALTADEILMLRSEFDKIDVDGSGDISREEFSLFYNQVMGASLNARQLEDYFDNLDRDHSGTLSFEEFVDVYAPASVRKQRTPGSPDYDDELDLVLDDKDDGAGIVLNIDELDEAEQKQQLDRTTAALKERSMAENLAIVKAQDMRQHRLGMAKPAHVDVEQAMDDMSPDLQVEEEDFAQYDNVDLQIDLDNDNASSAPQTARSAQ